MDIQDLGSIGEVVAALATVGTLVYLAKQIKTNSRQVSGQAIIAIGEAGRQLINKLGNNPALNKIVSEASLDWLSCSEEEQRQATYHFLDELTLHETRFMLWNAGALEDDTYFVGENHLLSLLAMPGRKVWFNSGAKHLIDPRFLKRIETQTLERANEIIPLHERLAMFSARSE